MLDAYFDREIDKDGVGRLSDTVRNDPRAARTFARTRWIVDSLRRTPEAPDFTHAVLARVHDRRAWLHPGVRRVVSLTRVAAVMALVGLLTIGLVARRNAPEAVVFNARPAPLTNVVESGGAEVADGLRSVILAVRTVRAAPSDAAGAIVIRNDRPQPAQRPAAAHEVDDIWSSIGVRTYVAPMDRPAPQFLRAFPADQPANARSIWLRPASSEPIEARAAHLRAG